MRRFWLIAAFSVLIFSAGCSDPFDFVRSTEQPPPVKQTETQSQELDQEETKAQVVQELQQLGEKELAAEEQETPPKLAEKAKPTHDIPITINSQVTKWIKYFQTKAPKRFKTWLERSGRYTPLMRSILKQYGLPEDLVYLAMIESGFSNRAYSRAHAVGPWQFIRGTGRRYGLKIDYWVDERRDPVKATHAASQYLRDLYAEFDSWYLAAAAYNAGEGKIRRAIKRYKTEDFWSMSTRRRRLLKSETKNYVPKMIAAAIIAKQPEKYGFHGVKYQKPLKAAQVVVHPGTSISISAKLAGISSSQLRELNPELRRWCTPPSRGMYKLNIPGHKVDSFQTRYAGLAPQERRAREEAVKFHVQRGDTLGGIARSFGVRVADIRAMNPRIDPRRLRIGQVVYVPPSKYSGRYPKRVNGASRSKKSSRSIFAAPSSTKRRVSYTVKKGDSLWTIAQVHKVDYRDIKRWNKKNSSQLKPGQKLVLYVPRAKKKPAPSQPGPAKPAAKDPTGGEPAKTYHIVKKGQSLWTIARLYGIDHKDLKKWNRKNSSQLKPGQKLVLYAPKSNTAGSTSEPEEKLLAKAEIQPAVQAEPAPAATYVVRRGDSLWKISRRFKVSPAAIRRWNSLRGNRITPGDVLTINK